MSTTMPPEIRMGNDIARHLSHLAPEAAAEQIATHIEKFWEPRMRRNFVRYMRGPESAEADPLLQAALGNLVTDDIDEQELTEPSGG